MTTEEKEKEIIDDPEKKDETKKEDSKPKAKKESEVTPLWAKELNKNMSQLLNSLTPAEKKAVTEVPIPPAPKRKEDEDDREKIQSPPNQPKPKSFLEWLL